MPNVLVLHIHPAPDHSVVHKELGRKAQSLGQAHEAITYVDLYAKYPRFKIDVEQEQELLEAHDILLLQYPIHWYSGPALLKEWIDLVFAHGFAYGETGTALTGKSLQLAVSCSGSEKHYSSRGRHKRPLEEYLFPMQQTAQFCGMKYLEPYIIYDSLHIRKTPEVIKNHAEAYGELLLALTRGEISEPKSGMASTLRKILTSR